ncbi:MAG: SsrA-binding protein [Parcubacteria group bacterium GW2011_GWD2_38_12]|uniref:SsrA-binding protein n=1 Tax=Candidatus Azambacteria bacterium RIFCSPLOWO2_01_FULL_37_9 TaxID=1797297 RepID=A0A1F5C871_9BACT|nr:MAG: SsrA-binding protein [Candidatus Moranbacteria bacterium GW2011_GWF2_37_7]KKQ43334.1 MAG: SsrA-binding protein [Parcubacteria group bacterium GW2011_GWE2_37_8]KKQ51053.1 MAG: SsrA-binding protein [Parcubacteria group bacterium GW2011_GWD2_38_12]OGD39062.1 MAG: SsrA-binding protein [Candidatus Azambacteria bacterium RIFCSPLOWO2_01_FULL_37_9]
MTELAKNKKAYFDYEILETFNAGIVLRGFEAKAVKTGKINIAGSFVLIRGNQAYLLNSDIPPYQPQNTPSDYDSKRTRSLLLHKKELKRLIGLTQQKGLTLIPLRVYNARNLVKLEFGLCRGKKKYEKREAVKKRDVGREIRRHLNS